MNAKISAIPSIRKLALALGLLIAAATLSATRANAQEVCNFLETSSICYESEEMLDRLGPPSWWATGSTGIVDETGRNRFAFLGTDAYVKSGHRGTVILRYPIDVEAQLRGIEGLLIRYRDDGPKARVRVKLIMSSLVALEHQDVVILEFDSDDRMSSPDLQTFVAAVPPNVLIGESILHLEVRLTRGHGGDPRLSTLSILRPREEDIIL